MRPPSRGSDRPDLLHFMKTMGMGVGVNLKDPVSYEGALCTEPECLLDIAPSEHSNMLHSVINIFGREGR